MSGVAPGIPIGLAMGMASGIAIGMASSVQAGCRLASKDAAAWRQQHGIVLTTPDEGAVDAQALPAVIAGKPGDRS